MVIYQILEEVIILYLIKNNEILKETEGMNMKGVNKVYETFNCILLPEKFYDKFLNGTYEQIVEILQNDMLLVHFVVLDKGNYTQEELEEVNFLSMKSLKYSVYQEEFSNDDNLIYFTDYEELKKQIKEIQDLCKKYGRYQISIYDYWFFKMSSLFSLRGIYIINGKVINYKNGQMIMYFYLSNNKDIFNKPEFIHLTEKARQIGALYISKQKTIKEKNGRPHLSKGLRYEVFKRDNFRCVFCGASKDDVIEGRNVVLNADHIIPVSRGGTDTLDNLQTLCMVCNASKSDLILQNPNIDNEEARRRIMEGENDGNKS